MKKKDFLSITKGIVDDYLTHYTNGKMTFSELVIVENLLMKMEYAIENHKEEEDDI